MSDSEKTLQQLIEWLKQDTRSNLPDSLSVRETSYGGRGIFASRPLKPRQQIIKITPSYLLNFSTIVAHILSWSSNVNKSSFKVPETEGKEDEITKFYAQLNTQTLHKLTSFQIMSMYTCLETKRGKRSWWVPFLESLPPFTDFVLSPLVWLLENDDREAPPFALLPPTTKAHAEKMYTRFTTDFAVIKALLDSHSTTDFIPQEDFLWAWFCVNSRCLYMSIPEAHTNDDNFTMAPYVDFINHSSQDHCSLQVDHNGFHVLTTLSYREDEEIYLSYGPHSNEFLLCEYGFMFPSDESNPWNDVDLTSKITELLSEYQSDFLKEHGYWGEYTINLNDVSFRVEVALAVLLEKDGDLYQNRRVQALMSGVSDGKYYKRKADQILSEILEELKGEADEKLQELEKGKVEESNTIRDLWKNQLQILNHHLKELQ